MKQNKINILFCLAKLPLLLLYVSFFIVQLFFNFDIAARSTGNALVLRHDKSSSTNVVKKAALPSGKKIGFRLNKRYQPQADITCNTIVLKPMVCYVSSKLHIHYRKGFTPASLPVAHCRRGPPGVV